VIKIKRVLIGPDGQILGEKKLPEDIPSKEKQISPNKIKLIRVNSAYRAPRQKREDQPVNGHWKFVEPLGKNGESGFVYLIYDIITKKMYIGKKFFIGSGIKNRGVVSNWPWYTSSCKELVESIRKNGKEYFEFYVLEQYQNRGTVSYAETWSLMRAETPANRHKFYNGLVNKISWPCKEQISDRHKKRLDALLSGRILVDEYV
jgi:hypothetical protein